MPYRTLEKAQHAAQVDIEGRLGKEELAEDRAVGLIRMLADIRATMLRHTAQGNRPRVELTFDDEADANRFVQVLTDARIHFGGLPKVGGA
jgi:hypothetical protein